MENQTKKSFVLDSKSLKIKEVLNQDFLAIEIYAISEGKTRNSCGFTLSSMEKAIPTFYNKFILGYFNVTGNSNHEGEFEEHNSDIKYDQELDEFYWSYTDPSAEKALGLIRESDSVGIVDYKGKKWIKLTAVLLTKYNREAVKHLLKSRSKRKISVEITIVKSHIENGFEWIDEFILDGITILGNRRNSNIPCEEGIEGASLKVLEFLKSDVFSRQQKALSFAYQELDKDNDNFVVQNEHKKEIIMDENQGGNTLEEKKEEKEGITLTYEQKRELLEKFLNDKLAANEDDNKDCCCCYVWVADIDEEYVYYHFEEAYYKAKYIIVQEEDKEVEVKVDLENQEQVVRGWKEFSAEEQDDTENKDNESKCEKCSEGCQNKEEDFEEDEQKSDEEKTDNDEEHKTDEEESKEDEFGCESQEEKSNMCNFTEDEGTVKESTITFECDGVNMTGEELVEKVSFLSKEVEKFKAECDSLNKIIKDTENAKIFTEGKAYILNEEELSAEEDAEIIKDLQVTFESMCNDSKFSTVEDAINYLDVELAKATYKKRKQNKKEEKMSSKAFSAPLDTENISSGIKEETDSFDEMKKILNI